MNTNERFLETLKQIAKENGFTYICQFDETITKCLTEKLIRFYTNEGFTEINGMTIEAFAEDVMNEKICDLEHIFNPCEIY